MAWTSDNYNPDLWVRGVKLSHLAWHSCVLPKHQYTFITKFNLKALLSRNTYNFQQWMSRLPQRWWTQRNAIRNANCKTSWIIKILNAHCAFGIYLRAYLFEYLWTPLNPTLWCLELDYGTELFLSSLLKYRTGFLVCVTLKSLSQWFMRTSLGYCLFWWVHFMCIIII